MDSNLIISVAFLVIGLILNYSINRRRFNRRNSSGLQQFSSYESSVLTRFIETIGKFIAILLMAVGLFATMGTCLSNQNKKKTKVVSAMDITAPAHKAANRR